MAQGFLTGRFLRGRETIFRRPARNRGAGGLTYGQLRRAFSNRSSTLADRRRSYVIRIQSGLALAIVSVLGFTRLPMVSEDEFDIPLLAQEVVQLEEIVQTKQIEAPPPPPRPPVPVEVPDEEILEDLDLNLDATLDIGSQLAALPPPPDEEEEEYDEQEIFAVVEQMPELLGGVQALMKAVTYPSLARKAEIEGMVVVKVVVDEQGVPSNPQILRSASQMLDAAAIEAVLKQRFKPGRQRNRPVKVEMAFPVTFRLTSQ